MKCPKCSAPCAVERLSPSQEERCPQCGAFVGLPPTQPHVPTVANTAQQGKTSAAALWRPGDVISDLYEIKQVHKSGGMGIVYRVYHHGWDVDLAVKSPRPELVQNERAKGLFEREAETWVRLGLHPHIVTCYYVRRLDGIPRIFAEYVNGGSLADWVRDGRLYA